MSAIVTKFIIINKKIFYLHLLISALSELSNLNIDVYLNDSYYYCL